MKEEWAGYYPYHVMIYGAGAGGYVVAENLNKYNGYYSATCFVDDNPSVKQVRGLPVYHTSLIGSVFHSVKHAFVAISDAKTRLLKIEQLLSTGFEIINVYGFLYGVEERDGAGTQYKRGCVIGPRTEIGDGCIIDNNSTISHDCILGAGVHISPGASLGSSITIGDRTIVGVGASIATGITIGKDCIITSGSSAVFDIEDRIVVEGVPGKVIGKRK